MSDIRVIGEAERDEFVRIFADAYPGIGVTSQEQRDKCKDRLTGLFEDPRVVEYGLFRDSKMVGIMLHWDFTMNLFGHKVLAGGVGDVAVDLTHKKEHIARELIEFYLEHYHTKGAPIAVLWPFRPDFYRQMGFGYGTKINQYRITPKDLPGSEQRKKVRYLTVDDAPQMNACYNRSAEKVTGMIQQLDIFWQRWFWDFPRFRFVGFENNGRLEGFLQFEFVPHKKGSFIRNDLAISEFVYESREAFDGLVGFLHSQFDQIDTVVFNSGDDQFHFVPADPRNGEERLIPPVYHQSNICGVGIMYRLLNVGRAFEILSDHDFGGQDCQLKLTVADSFFPKNDGSTLVHFVGGRATVVPDGSFDIEVTIDIADFSSMFLGAVSFRKLYEYGLAQISDKGQIETVHRLFYREEKPFCTTPF